MPVKSRSRSTQTPPEVTSVEHVHAHHCGWGMGEAGKKLLTVLFGIFMVYMIVFVGTLIRNNLQKYYSIGKMDKPERVITVDAEGKVKVRPDIGLTTLGMISEAPTVSEAQKKNTEVMNKLIERLKALGIDSKDIQSANYNVYPLYNYKEGDQVLRGYQVASSVNVKLRGANLEQADKVLALAGEVGANNVSGLTFTVDDKEVYKEQAREMAMRKVNEKAQNLASALGVNIVGVVGYSEYEGSASANQAQAYRYDVGAGGAGAPTVEAGVNDIVMTVNVTFEIR